MSRPALFRNSAQFLFDLMQQLNEQMNTSFIVVAHDFDLAGRMQRALKLVEGMLLKKYRSRKYELSSSDEQDHRQKTFDECGLKAATT